MRFLYFLFPILAVCAMTTDKFPQAEISNGLIHARFYIPDSLNCYYQGSRFDWSGNLLSLVYNNHEYFGRWFAGYDHDIRDSIMGPVEEFAPLDYTETKRGDGFLKIGIGVLSKSDDKPYTSGNPYLILNRGNWSVKKQSDQIRFIHQLHSTNYSYWYEKAVLLVKGKPQMILAHTLRNTGSRTIETNVYSHNFFFIDKQPIGPDFSIIFPFNLNGKGPGIGELAKIEGNKILFTRNLKKDETVYCGALVGYGTTVKDFDIRIENQTTGAKVRITCDRPIMQLAFWACSATICPEPFIKIKVEPGQEFKWNINYEF